MIRALFRRRRRDDTISALYGMIVAQARLPDFYREYGVPDTVNGRFDLIVLHLALVLGRLKPGADQDADHDSAHDLDHDSALAQRLFDRFCRDMDDNLREMGVADLKVPKQMRHIGEAFYGRVQAYHAALGDLDDTALIVLMARNVYGAAAAGQPAARLAAYVREAVASLDRQSPAEMAAGVVRFINPASVSGPKA